MHPFEFSSRPAGQQYQGYQRYREMSIEDMLQENRIIFLAGPITERSASTIIMRLLFLQQLNADQPIHLYINSPGGYVDQTLAIYDTMQFLGCDVATYCIGSAVSGAAIVLAAGAKGSRFMLPHSKVMIHQPHGGVTGQAEDIHIQAEEILRDKQILCEILSKHTGKKAKQIEADSERDRYMNPKEALKYGLIDDILEEAPSDKSKADK